MFRKYQLLLVIFTLFISACGTKTPYYSFQHRKWDQSAPPQQSELIHTVFLVGDSGDPKPDGKDPLFNMLSYHMQNMKTPADPQNQSIIFLGDNIYEHGLPKEGSLQRSSAEEAITIQLEVIKNFNGNIVFIPGNHDWDHSGPDGYNSILRQQRFIKSYLNRPDVFLPEDGCPGPVELPIGEDMVMIFLDTEWYLHPHYKPSYPDCTVESDSDFFFEFRRAVKRNEGKHILVALHHPLFSNGNHGGHFSLKDNLFPLSLLSSKLYLPLPILGSVYTLLRKYGISNQDIPNAEYQELKEGLLEAVKDVKNVTFASGHDHNLQLTQVEDKNFIVSGSASKVNYARQGLKAAYVHSAQGFAIAKYYANGEVWVEFYAVGEKPEGELTFRSPLYALDPTVTKAIDEDIALVDYSDSVKTIIAGRDYTATASREVVLGRHYRKEWTTPVQVDYLDINNVAGGLTPIKMGGGQQTISLRMMGKDGHQYNLRSINKNPAGAIPSPFRNTFAQDIVQDQISSAHPYGAFTIPPLATAAGLYHTNPKLVYIPYSPVLGEYLNTFGGMTALFEIRPDEDLSEFKRFGKTENAVSTRTMLEHLKEDNDHEADDEMYLKSRLFDLLINDWDRHEDQWRWSEVEKEGKGSIFEPIPRDRDQVYSKYDGAFPWIASRRWAIRHVNHFDHDYDDPIGLALSGNSLDRQILNQLAMEDWREAVKDLQLSLTDSVIHEAIQQLPEEIYPISGEEIIAKLKSRRDNLMDAALIWYKGLSRDVDVLGTDKHERFEIERKGNGEVSVVIYKTKKEGNIDKEIYSRVFDPSFTKEIRIYTFEGNDVVQITGEKTNDIKIRIITSSETKEINNSSGVNRVIAYKKNYFNELEVKGDVKVHASNYEYINEYRPSEYKYSYLGPRLSVQFNRDAGIFLGGGVHIKTHGFNRRPFKSSHTLMANYATSINAYNLSYEGEFPDIFGHNLDLRLSSHYYSPQYVFNYFGTGNGTENTQNIDFYRVDLGGFSQKIFLQKSIGESVRLGIGPTFNYYDAAQNSGNVLDSDIFESDEDLAPGRFLGSELYFDIDKSDNTVYPRNGLKWKNKIGYLNNINGADEFVRLQSDFSVYLTPNLPFYLTLATRFGIQSNFGDHPFYLSSFLGGNSNLRGFRMQRFAGETAAFQNTELRLGVSKVNSYLFNGYWGIFGFVDHGRVWADNPQFESKKWHRGYGPGIWVNFFKFFMTSAGFGFSEEGNFIYVRAGMFF
ncbi:MAG: metallophosphoesterase [Bacteroidota bacterium]